jgi:hypothetical protein
VSKWSELKNTELLGALASVRTSLLKEKDKVPEPLTAFWTSVLRATPLPLACRIGMSLRSTLRGENKKNKNIKLNMFTPLAGSFYPNA